MNKLNLGKVKSIVQDERFDAFLELAKELKDKWNSEKGKKETEFDTIWELAYLSGKVDGINDYLTNLQNDTV